MSYMSSVSPACLLVQPTEQFCPGSDLVELADSDIDIVDNVVDIVVHIVVDNVVDI